VALATYTQLQTAVQDWLSRADLADRVPDFITLCEAKLNRVLRCPQMEQRSYSDVDLSTDEPEMFSLPTDFQTMRSVRLSSVSGKPRLEYLTKPIADDYRYSRYTASGQPVYFTVFGDEFELIPTPDEEYEIEMIYRTTIPPLASNSTNWLLTAYPDAYLYGALMEAAPFLEDDKRIGIWAAGYASAVATINSLAIDHMHNAGPLTVRITGSATP
jgi:hypothetical protein